MSSSSVVALGAEMAVLLAYPVVSHSVVEEAALSPPKRRARRATRTKVSSFRGGGGGGGRSSLPAMVRHIERLQLKQDEAD